MNDSAAMKLFMNGCWWIKFVKNCGDFPRRWDFNENDVIWIMIFIWTFDFRWDGATGLDFCLIYDLQRNEIYNRLVIGENKKFAQIQKPLDKMDQQTWSHQFQTSHVMTQSATVFQSHKPSTSLHQTSPPIYHFLL